MVRRDEKLAFLIRRLQAITEDLSGYPIEDLDPGQTFLELGFDSLFLTQLATAFSKSFDVRITFRQLFDELPTLSSLAEHLGQVAPASCEPGAAAADGPTSIVEEAAIRPLLDRPPSDLSSPPELPMDASNPSELEAILGRQLELMREQLRVLDVWSQEARSTSGSPRPSAVQTPMASVANAPAGEPVESPVPMPAAAGALGGGVSASSFGPAPVTATSSPLLPRDQQHLDALTEAYTRRTAGSKERTQRYRRVLADPRTAAGFNRRWKEMVYPIWVERSKGSRLWDVDGNEYIDLLNGFGPNFLGHSPDFVTRAVHEQLERGVEVGPQTPLVGEVAEALCELTGMDRASFMCTGSEAVQAVKRLARTKTGRDKVVVFSGDYHGNFDQVLVRGANGKAGLRTRPLVPGIPLQTVEDTYVLEYGSDEALEVIRARAHEIAAVLVEPVQSRRPEFQPREFLHALRRITEEAGICLVFDEVITGFRIAQGGAQAHFGVRADVATYGKVVGGGMPIGIVAGRREWMDTFDGGHWEFGNDSFPEEGVTFFAGTFVRHPLAIVAAKAALDYIREQGPDLQRRVSAKADRICAFANALFERHRIAIEMPHSSSQMYIRLKEQHELAPLLFFHLRHRGIHLLEGFPTYMTDAHTDEDLARIEEAFQESVEIMVGAGIIGDNVGTDAVADRSPFPLTSGQHEIWFASQLGSEAACAYNESDTLSLRGALDDDLLRQCVQDVLRRHDAFHLRFDRHGEHQQVSSQREIEIAVHDWSGEEPEKRGAHMRDLLASEASTPFDLENGPLIRVHLVRYEPDHHVLVLYANHLVFDGWSSGVVFDEIGRLYSARRAQAEPEFPIPTSFREYAALESAAAADGRRDAARDHWVAQFDGTMPTALELPTDRPRDAQRSFEGGTVKWALHDATYHSLKQLAATRNCSVFALLLAAYKVMLARLTGQHSLVIGVSVAGQAMSGLEALVGHGVNLIPLRVDWEASEPFADVLQRTRREVLDLAEFHDTTLGDVLAVLPIERDPSRAPLVEAMFNFSSSHVGDVFEGLVVDMEENPRRFVNFDLFANLLDSGGRLTADWDYSRALFDESTVRRWIGHFETLLESIIATPEAAVGSLPMLSAEERRAILERVNDTDVAYSPSTTIHGLFEHQADSNPHAIALRGISSDPDQVQGERLSYSELEKRSNQLAHRLREFGVGSGDRVLVCVDRSVDMVVGLLGILKAGAAYVPVDPAYPNDRIAFMVEDAAASVIVADSGSIGGLPGETAPVLLIDDESALLARLPSDRIDSGAGPRDIAYLIYTSGSTGKPKGIEVPHHCVVNFLRSMATWPGLAENDVLMAVTTISFDISALEIFLPLSVGACCVVADGDTTKDGEALRAAIEESEATVMQATPTTWRLLLESGWPANRTLKVLCGGEALPLDLARDLCARAGEVWNMYGPTETTIWSTCHRVNGEDAVVVVGSPIANTQIYVLDEYRSPVPIGTPGELYIGGEGVSRGYFNRDELTSERFVPDSFRNDGGRLYRTGDLARLRANGTLEILGRLDEQVKVRGFRIELGEIEAAMTACAAVHRAVASIWRAGSGDDRIVGYVVPRRAADLDWDALRASLRETLPEYMVPQHFVPLEAVPMTPNGKMDRQALPAPGGEETRPGQTVIEPSTPIERRLVEIWAETLRVENIALDADFFDLGGHSLLAARMLARLRKEYDVDLSFRGFFSAPTVRGLAEYVESQVYAEQSVPLDPGEGRSEIEI